MKFGADPKIFQLFPDLRLGVIIATDIDNSGINPATASLLRNAETKIRQRISLENLVGNPLIANWKTVYKDLKVKDGRPSHEALARRVLKGGEIPHINKLVDIYNSLSLEYLTPFGGEDLGKITGDLTLGFATGNENFMELGSREVSHPVPGEVVYADKEKILCRKFNWRESEKTKLTEFTKEAFFVTETIPPFPDTLIEKALIELSGHLSSYCSAETKIFKVDAGNPSIEWP